jgi:A/G-specific adenine glycosylase
MNEQLRTFTDRLFRWYEQHRRDLPWRRNPTPYRVWISEVMLQQTTVGAVRDRFEQWVDLFPDLHGIARATEQDVLAAWEGLGYYQRARRLHAAARRMEDQHGGRVPRKKKALLDLPGIGPYIASAVRSLAFGEDEVAIDANLRRVFMRLLALPGRPQDPQARREVRDAAERALRKGHSSRFNQALMDFGSLVCRSPSPDCGRCFAPDICRAFQQGLQEDIPERRRRTLEEIATAVAIFTRDSTAYIQRRPPEGLFAAMWEFPGGKVEEGESPAEAVVREIREELGVGCAVVEKLTEFVHYYTRFEVTLHAFLCSPAEEPPRDDEHRWVGMDVIADYPMPSANRKLVARLEKWMEGGNPDEE